MPTRRILSFAALCSRHSTPEYEVQESVQEMEDMISYRTSVLVELHHSDKSQINDSSTRHRYCEQLATGTIKDERAGEIWVLPELTQNVTFCTTACSQSSRAVRVTCRMRQGSD